MDKETKSNLSLENRTLLTMTGIKKVRTTEPQQIVANLENCVVVINGLGLSVQNISIREELLEVSGLVTSIRYTSDAQSKRFSFRNLFR